MYTSHAATAHAPSLERWPRACRGIVSDSMTSRPPRCNCRTAQSRQRHLLDQQLRVVQLRRWQLRAEQLAQQQVTRSQERAPPPRSISTGCSRLAVLLRRLHLGDRQLRVAQLLCS